MSASSAPTIIASRYRVLRELGRGGMGVVYVVEHAHTGDQLALKLLLGRAAQDPASIERFKREARASARIKSENVVKVVDADVAPELDGAPFLVMELLNGTDLQKQLEQRGRFSSEEALHYLGQAARALDKSHSLGIVHRDLKPENLFLHTREDGTKILKILDFGISKIVGGDGGNDIASAGMTNTGAVMGTPLYMSPEQARGRIAEIAPATDVWAIGLIAVQLITGEIYWRANSVGELMAQIISEPLYAPSERWPGLPRAVDAWLARSCARDPKQRFGTVGEQIAALAAAFGQRLPGVAASPDASAPRPALASAPAVPALADAPILGARTTTSATARDGGAAAPQARARTGAALIGGAAAIGVVAGLAVIVARAYSTPSASGAGALGASVGQAPVAVSAAAPVPPTVTTPPIASSPPSTAPAAEPAPARAADAGPDSARHHRKPPPSVAPAQPSPQAPATQPTPPPAATPHRFDPSSP